MIDPRQYQSIVVLTGAGISAESGLKTFRDSGGLWEGHRVEEVATPEAFSRNPELVHKFYNLRRAQLVQEAEPNAAHRALAAFERTFSGEFLLVTQNVDDLHERGGSLTPLHMHGELLSARCQACGAVYDFTADDMSRKSVCPCCQSSGTTRPNIVWFGEMPMGMERIEAALARCDLFVSIGTSGQVYPAAGFVQLAVQQGATAVELNMEPSHGASFFHEQHNGPATDLVSRFFRHTGDGI